MAINMTDPVAVKELHSLILQYGRVCEGLGANAKAADLLVNMHEQAEYQRDVIKSKEKKAKLLAEINKSLGL